MTRVGGAAAAHRGERAEEHPEERREDDRGAHQQDRVREPRRAMASMTGALTATDQPRSSVSDRLEVGEVADGQGLGPGPTPRAAARPARRRRCPVPARYASTASPGAISRSRKTPDRDDEEDRDGVREPPDDEPGRGAHQRAPRPGRRRPGRERDPAAAVRSLWGKPRVGPRGRRPSAGCWPRSGRGRSQRS